MAGSVHAHNVGVSLLSNVGEHLSNLPCKIQSIWFNASMVYIVSCIQGFPSLFCILLQAFYNGNAVSVIRCALIVFTLFVET